MADISNLKINEHSDEELPNLLRELIQWKIKIEKIPNIEWTNNSKICYLLEWYIFPNWKNSENLIIFKGGKLKKKINLENDEIFEIVQFEKLMNFQN